MLEFLEGAPQELKIFWYVAIPVSVIFLIQTVMTFLGADASDGGEVDFSGDFDAETPFQLFSLRNLINFLLGFSWGGISFWNIIENKSLLLVIAFGIGASFVLLFFLLMRQMNKLQEDNSVHITQAKNKIGSVYFTIPAQKSGFGKIQISINGSQKEYQAITNGEALASGAAIRVVEIIDDNICVVEPL